MGFDFATGKNIVIEIRRLPKDLPDFLFNTMLDLQAFFLENVQRLAPKKTGEYARSWVKGPLKLIESTKTISSTIITPEFLLYTMLEFQGRQPGEILGKPILHFFWEKTGQEMFLRKVMHPGFPPMPHVRPALDITLQNAPRIINENLQKNYRIFG